MQGQKYGWKRFWIPRSEAVIPLSDSGFFPDPGGQSGLWLNQQVTTYEAINHFKCLVLLGEPGIGKSAAMQAEYCNQKHASSERQDNVSFLDFDLRSYGDEGRLIRDLFEGELFKAWFSGSGILVIFLDSYDECLLELKKLGQLLAEKLKHCKSQIDRLYLRIACRTAVWPSYLEDELKRLYGEDSIGIYQLAPLRRVDVEVAAAQEGFDSGSFINAIRDNDVVSFSIKPITLRFLLSFYRSHGSLDSTTKVDLYRNGCICLCEEPNESRFASSQQGKLDANQRFVIAARIAAVTKFSNREAIWSGTHQGYAPSQDFSIISILGKSESYDQNQFNVSYEDIKETLDTGLFSARGENRLGWAHQSYAEFLAAWYINHHQTPIHEISGLLFSHDQQNRRLIPQLQQTAAWLGSMRQDVFELIVQSDPEALLTADIGDNEQNARLLVGQLLSHLSHGSIHDYYRYVDAYHLLQHSGLAGQLRPFINPKRAWRRIPFYKKCAANTRSNEARHAAILISKQCRIKELQQDLVDLALDPTEDNFLRSSAACAISDYAEEIYKQRLRPLALDAGSDDANDELKGYSLSAAWPNHISATEMFAHLTKPKIGNFTGSYRYFIYSKLAPHLNPSDLPVALDWLKRQGMRDSTNPYEDLGDQIVFKASHYLDQPDVLCLFADVALNQWEGHQRVLPIANGQQTHDTFPSLENDNTRRDLLGQVVSLSCDRQSRPHAYRIYRDICKPIDFSWILSKLNEANSHSLVEDEMWASLLLCGFDITNPCHVDAILTSSQTSSVLKAAFRDVLEPIDLDSETASRLKEFYGSERNIKEGPNLAQINVPLDQQINELLNAIEAGASDAFWVLLNRLSLRPDNSLEPRYLVELDIRKLPGWIASEQEAQARIANAAILYLRECDQRSCDWSSSDQIDLPFIAGCKALYLLMHTDQGRISELSADCWRTWAAAVVCYPNVGSHDVSYLSLVQRAYHNAPIETLSAVEIILARAKKDRQPIDFGRFSNCWDERLNALVAAQLIDQSEYSQYHESLLRNLIKRREAKAVKLALDLIKKPLAQSNSDTSKERAKVKIAARILLENADSMIWPAVWQLIERDQGLGRETVEGISPIWLRDPNLELTETQLADFYLWLTRQYPEINRSGNEGVYCYQMADHIADLRRNILKMLERRGTPLACQEILRLSGALPELPWLKQVHLESKKVMLSATWLPLEPGALLELITKHQIQEMGNKSDPAAVHNTINVGSINTSGDGNIVNLGPSGANTSTPAPIGRDKDWKFWLALGVSVLGTLAGIIAIVPLLDPGKTRSDPTVDAIPKNEQAKPPKATQ